MVKRVSNFKLACIFFLVATFVMYPLLGVPVAEASSRGHRHAFALRDGYFYRRASTSEGTRGSFTENQIIRNISYHNRSRTWMSTEIDGRTVFVRARDVRTIPLADHRNRDQRRRGFATSGGNIYRHPSRQSRVVDTFERGREFRNVRRFDAAGNWLRVTIDGSSRYVRASNVRLTPLHNHPQRNQQRRGFARQEGTIFRRPSTLAATVDTFERHADFRDIRRTDAAGNWLRVNINGQRGYIRSRDISLATRRTVGTRSVEKRVEILSDKNHFPAASTSARSNGQLSAGSTVIAIPWTRNNGWFTTEVDGRRVFFTNTNVSYSYHVRVARNPELNRQLERRMNRVLNSSMTRSEMKRALYDNTVRSVTWTRDDSALPSGWRETFALEALTTGRGNCFRSAAMFGFLAKSIGYDATIVRGHILNVRGTWVRHGWVEIRKSNGRVFVYDPDLERALSGSFYRMPRFNERAWYRR